MAMEALASSVSKSPGSTGPAPLPVLVHPHPAVRLRSAVGPLWPCVPYLNFAGVTAKCGGGRCEGEWVE